MSNWASVQEVSCVASTVCDCKTSSVLMMLESLSYKCVDEVCLTCMQALHKHASLYHESVCSLIKDPAQT